MFASYLKQKGVTALGLSRQLGVSHSTVLRWADVGIPANRLADLSRVTGIPAALLRPDLAATFTVCHPIIATVSDADRNFAPVAPLDTEADGGPRLRCAGGGA
jgi:lambda repressor-like predicted transcriptional regulator